MTITTALMRSIQIGDSRERHLNEIDLNRAYLKREKLL